MTVDYDTPRTRTEDLEAESLEEVSGARGRVPAPRTAGDEPEDAVETDSYVLPGGDLSEEILVLEVQPQQADEFICTGCFLVRHRSQLVDPVRALCGDCA